MPLLPRVRGLWNTVVHRERLDRDLDDELQDDDVREIRGPLVALFAGVAILLLIACVNVASLLLARAAPAPSSVSASPSTSA